jgi:hypothetical protein
LSAGLAYHLDAVIVDLGLLRRDGLSIIQYWRYRDRTDKL